jgi:hypothetical protein
MFSRRGTVMSDRESVFARADAENSESSSTESQEEDDRVMDGKLVK